MDLYALSMSTQRKAPINKHAIKAAMALGTKPLTISATMIASEANARGALLAAGATSSISTGRLKTRKWQDSNGNDRYSTEIILENFIFLDAKGPQDGEHGADVHMSEGGSDDLPF